MDGRQIFEMAVAASWAQGGLLSTVTLFRRNRSPSSVLFSLLLLSVLLTETFVTLRVFQAKPNWYWVYELSFLMGILSGSLLYLYTLALIRNNVPPARSILLAVAPFSIAIPWYLWGVLTQSMPEDSSIAMTLEQRLRVGFVTLLFGVALWASIREVKKAEQEPQFEGSRRKPIVRWLHFLLRSFLIVWVALLVSNFLNLRGPQWLWAPLAHTLLLLGFGFYMLCHSTLFNEATQSNGKARLDPVRMDSRIQRLERLMKDTKLFTRSGLKLSDLADEMGLRPQETSELINQGTGMSFYEYLNRYRIEEAKARLLGEEYRHMTIIAIAMDCGFNSKSAFNEVFKEVTGLTPSEFRKEAGVLSQNA